MKIVLIGFVVTCTGELHVPFDVCGVVIRRELTYWQIDPDKAVESCCWLHYCEHLNDHESLGKKFDFAIEQERRESDMINAATGWRRTRLRIWRMLSRPATSRLAFVSSLCYHIDLEPSRRPCWHTASYLRLYYELQSRYFGIGKRQSRDTGDSGSSV